MARQQVPHIASAATWARAHARGAGLSRTQQHTATSPRGTTRPRRYDHGIWRGGGGQGWGPDTMKVSARTAGPSGAGEREATTKTLSR